MLKANAVPSAQVLSSLPIFPLPNVVLLPRRGEPERSGCVVADIGEERVGALDLGRGREALAQGGGGPVVRRRGFGCCAAEEVLVIG